MSGCRHAISTNGQIQSADFVQMIDIQVMKNSELFQDPPKHRPFAQSANNMARDIHAILNAVSCFSGELRSISTNHVVLFQNKYRHAPFAKAAAQLYPPSPEPTTITSQLLSGFFISHFLLFSNRRF